MTRRRTSSAFRWLWLLLLPLPSMMAYAESGDPLATMSEISNRAAKGDRLPLAPAADVAWTSCPPKLAREQMADCVAKDIKTERAPQTSAFSTAEHP